MTVDRIERQALIVAADLSFDDIARGVVTAVAEGRVYRRAKWAEIHRIFERIIQNPVLCAPRAPGGPLEADDRECARISHRIVVDDTVRTQRGLAAVRQCA